MTVVPPFTGPASRVTVLRTTDRPEQKYSLAFVGYDTEDRAAALELTYNYGVDRYDVGTAYGHVAVEVDDAAKTCEAVRAKGGKVFRRYDGVLSTRVCYTGGDVSHATYRNHRSHAEPEHQRCPWFAAGLAASWVTTKRSMLCPTGLPEQCGPSAGDWRRRPACLEGRYWG